MKRLSCALFLLTGCGPEVAVDAALPCQPNRAGCPQSTGASQDPLLPLGRADTDSFIEITDIITHGGVAYLCTGVQALMTFELTADGLPRLLAKDVRPSDELSNPDYPRCQHVALEPSTSRLVVTSRGDEVQPQSWLAVFDVSTPSSPELIATWAPPQGSIEGVDIRGDRIFAAMHRQGVAALRLEGDTIVETDRVLETGADAWQPVLHDDTLIVAEGEAGVRIYDLTEVGLDIRTTVTLRGSSRDLLVDGGRAYVTTSGGVAVIELGDAPAVLGEHTVAGSPLDVARLGPGQVALAEWDALRGYDLSDPSQLVPLFSETVVTENTHSRVLAVGTHDDGRRVLAGEWTGLHAYAFAPAAGPEVDLNPTSLHFGSVDVDETDARVLVVSNQGTTPLTVHDITGPPQVSVDEDERCFVVEPGQSTAVEIELKPTSELPLRTTVRVCSDDPDEPEAHAVLTANIGGLGVGEPAPAFSLQDLEGNTWSSADLEGKVAVLAYFATF